MKVKSDRICLSLTYPLNIMPPMSIRIIANGKISFFLGLDTEDEMVGWHHQLNGHGFGWTPGVGDGQEGLAYCSSWGHKELYMSESLTVSLKYHYRKLSSTGIS